MRRNKADEEAKRALADEEKKKADEEKKKAKRALADDGRQNPTELDE